MHMINEKTAVLLLSLGAVWSNSALAGSVGAMTTFSAGSTASAAEVNGNFDTITAAVDDNDARITAIETDIATSITNDIGSNASDIVNNINAISGLQSDVATKQAQLTGSCADGSAIRVINADGSVVCEVDDAQNGSASFSSMSMQVTASDLCDIRKNYTGGYVSFHTTSTWSSCSMVNGVQLPDQATPTALHCRIWDNDGTADSPIVKLYRVPGSGGAAELMYETPAVTDAPSVQYVSSSTNQTLGAIDNSSYNYFLVFANGGVDTTTSGTDVRFYNCYVEYGFNLLN